MKTNRKLLSVLLSLALVLAMCPTVFAGTPDNVKHYDTVCCIGDSVGTGYSGAVVLGEQTQNPDFAGMTDDFMFKTTDEAFASLVSKAVNADKYYSLTCVGIRTVDALYMLDAPGYSNYNLYADIDVLGEGVVKAIKSQKNRKTAADGTTAKAKIAQSDLVIIQLGSNDAFASPLFKVLFSGKLITPSKIIKEMKKGADTLIENYPKLLSRIKDLNPDATIVVLNQFSPFECLAIRILGQDINIGKTITELLSKNNHYYEDWAKEYGAVFVDITGVADFFETAVINSKDFNFLTFDTHFGPNGHVYVAEKIIEALPEAKTYLSAPENGTYGVSFNGNDAGNYEFTKVRNGWTIKDTNGKYVCFNSLYGISLRSVLPTVWHYDGGFYTSGMMIKHMLGLPYIKTGKQYLSYNTAGQALVSSSGKADAALFVRN